MKKIFVDSFVGLAKINNHIAESNEKISRNNVINSLKQYVDYIISKLGKKFTKKHLLSKLGKIQHLIQ